MKGIPAGSRAAKPDTFLTKERITPELLEKIKALNDIAANRGQSLAQMAIAWLLGVGNITSVLVGASSAEQIRENVSAAENIKFTSEECELINKALKI